MQWCIIYFVWYKPKIKTLLHVFDHTVKPILTYGSEVWCTFDPQKLLDKGDNYFSKLCDDLKAEKANINFVNFHMKLGKEFVVNSKTNLKHLLYTKLREGEALRCKIGPTFNKKNNAWHRIKTIY